MPNGNPLDGFSYPTLTLMMDFYNLTWVKNNGNPDLVCENIIYGMMLSTE